ncbi:MAG: hypothetical protein WKG07_02295 [Hymenobacter sp.]
MQLIPSGRQPCPLRGRLRRRPAARRLRFCRAIADAGRPAAWGNQALPGPGSMPVLAYGGEAALGRRCCKTCGARPPTCAAVRCRIAATSSRKSSRACPTRQLLAFLRRPAAARSTRARC